MQRKAFSIWGTPPDLLNRDPTGDSPQTPTSQIYVIFPEILGVWISLTTRPTRSLTFRVCQLLSNLCSSRPIRALSSCHYNKTTKIFVYINVTSCLKAVYTSYSTLELGQVYQHSSSSSSSSIGWPYDPVLLLVESGLVGVAKYLKSKLLNYDVLSTAASLAGIISFWRRASSPSRVQYTYHDDARRHNSSQGVKQPLVPLVSHLVHSWKFVHART